MTNIVSTRRATPADSLAMAEILNEIIAIGGTTAHENSYSAEQITNAYICHPRSVSCTVAEIGGQVVAFQAMDLPNPENQGYDRLPADWGSIATFVKVGLTGAGVGAHLFQATKNAASAAGVPTIDATIRADNTGGLRYYSKMGFIDYDVLTGIPLKDGTPVDRIRKRFEVT